MTVSRAAVSIGWTITVGMVGLVAIGCRRVPQTIEEGRRLYRVNGCASCHGPEGHGDGQVADTLRIRPRDFRDAQAFKRGRSVEQVADTLKSGFGNDLGRMPAFGHLSDDERRALAVYVISLAPASERSNQP